MASRMNGRLAKLEAQQAPADLGFDARVSELLERIETASDQPWALTLHDSACPRGWSAQGTLRDADAVDPGDVLQWYAAAQGHKLPALPPLCPLCTPDPTVDEEYRR